MPITPQSPLRGGALGGASAAAVERALGLRTVGELLRHYPRRYVERGELTDLSDLRVGEDVTVVAEVREVRLRNLRPRPGERRRRTLLEVKVGDGKHSIDVKFFNKHWLEKTLQVGTRGLFAGTVSQFNRTRELTNPDFALLDDDPAGPGGTEEAAEFAARPVPIYPTARKLPVRTIETCIKHVLSVLEPIDDPLPAALRGKHRLVGYMTAVHDIHQPPDSRAIGAARKRLKWDEAIVLQVALAQRRHAAAARSAIARPARRRRSAGRLRRAAAVRADRRPAGGRRGRSPPSSAASHPMHRLLQGEVGSRQDRGRAAGDAAGRRRRRAGGAARADRGPRRAARPIARGAARPARPRRASSAAPTQATRVALLTGSLTAPGAEAARRGRPTARAGIVVGTHALLQDAVQFADLGLVVVDEQHRFGVEQRDALRGKAADPPHVLVMTATPIPRTVAMTVFGDLETSSLRELPARPVADQHHRRAGASKPRWIDRMWERVREEVAAGHQAYVVCPRIGEAGETGPTAPTRRRPRRRRRSRRPTAAEDAAARAGRGGARRRAELLADGPLRGLRVEMLHGRLPADEKDARHAPRSRPATSTCSSRPPSSRSASTCRTRPSMVVLDADRFGVSQLHQLRGRVGRGGAAGCACWSPSRPRTRRPASGWRPSPRPPTASSWPGSTSSSAARATCSARRSPAAAASCGCCRCSATRTLIAEARGEATALVAADPRARRPPAPWPPRSRRCRRRAGRLPGEGVTPHRRGRRRRPAARRAARVRHPADVRPGPGGAVHHPRRAARPRRRRASSTCTPGRARSGWRRSRGARRRPLLVGVRRRARCRRSAPTSPRSACPAPGARGAGRRASSPATPPRAYDVVFLDPPYAARDRRAARRALRDSSRPAGSPQARSSSSSARPRGPGVRVAGGHDRRRASRGATARRRSGTVADRETRRLSRVRSTRSPTAISTSSCGPAGSTTRSSSRSGSTRPRTGCSPPRSACEMLARRSRRPAQRHGRHLPRPDRRLLPRATRSR